MTKSAIGRSLLYRNLSIRLTFYLPHGVLIRTFGSGHYEYNRSLLLVGQGF